jgi:6-hydroxytryprostatin B O-methyltransferase
LHDFNAYRYVFRYKIAQAVPLDSSISYDDLAAATGVDATQLKQFLRQLMQIRVFCEVDGRVSHTAPSKLLLNPGPGAGAVNAFVAEDVLPIVAKQVDALDKWGHGSQELTQTALNYAYDTDKYMFAYLEENHVVRERFGNVMVFTTGADAMSYRHILTGFDWAALGEATVVDIAGSMGACSVQIASANPKLKLIVQDLPNVIERAQDPQQSVVPEELRSRVSFMVQDFFQPQAVNGADVYFQRMSFQNFSDKYAIQMLRALVPAMGPHSRLIVTDQCLPPVGAPPATIERFMRTQDLNMLLLLNAKQRDYGQWNHLFKSADPRLTIKNVITPPGSIMSFIEVVLEAANGETVNGST